MQKYYIIDNNQFYSSSLFSQLKAMGNDVHLSHGEDDDMYYHREIILKKPDIVIMDLRFPRFNGLDLLHRLAEDDHTNHIPVFIYTFSENKNLEHLSTLKGARHFCLKEEFPVEAFINRVSKIYNIRKNI